MKRIPKINSIIQWIFKCLGAGMLSILILSLFTLIYSYSGTHIDNVSGETDYKWIAGQYRSNATEGFSWAKVDENGFNNVNVKSTEAIDILLMGSSHMEAFNVAQDKTTASILNLKLGTNLYTYNIGISGHDFYRCARNIRAAVSTNKPGKYVILETSLIKLNTDKINLVLDGKLDKIKSYDSGLLFQLQKVPCLKWLYKHFEALMLNSFTADDIVTAKSLNEEKEYEEYIDALDSLLKMLSATVYENDCRLIIVYHPRLILKADGSAFTATEERYLTIFKQACEDNGIIFVDMTDDFLDEYSNNYVLPHGFSNTAVGGGHLNEHGHRMIADRLYNIITNPENSSSTRNGGGVEKQ